MPVNTTRTLLYRSSWKEWVCYYYYYLVYMGTIDSKMWSAERVKNIPLFNRAMPSTVT